MQLALLRNVWESRARKCWPMPPFGLGRMPDRYRSHLLLRYDIPQLTANGYDVGAYLDHLWGKLLSSKADEERQPTLRSQQRQLHKLRHAAVGARMPRLSPWLAGRLAGMAMLDRRFGSRCTPTYRAALVYVYTQEWVTDLICDWVGWVAMFGVANRSHDKLHGGNSSLAEVSALSELINFTREILRKDDANWVSVSSSEKRQVGSGRRTRMETVDRPIAGWQTRFIRDFLTLAGIRDQHGRMLSLAAARQRVERCRKQMRSGVAAGRGPNALGEFLEARASVPMSAFSDGSSQ